MKKYKQIQLQQLSMNMDKIHSEIQNKLWIFSISPEGLVEKSIEIYYEET